MSTALAHVLIVCGGRSYPNRALVFRALDEVARRLPVRVVRHGACQDRHGKILGADRWADEWARARGLEVDSHPADWSQHGRAAGPIRNGEMLALGGVLAVAAFPGGSGTADMMRQARAAGIWVWEVKPTPAAHP